MPWPESRKRSSHHRSPGVLSPEGPTVSCTEPPPGMASMALFMRFKKSCSICLRSTSREQPGGASVCTVTEWAARVGVQSCCRSARRSAKVWGSRCSWGRRVRSRRRRTMSPTRWIWDWMTWSRSRALSGRPFWDSRSWRWPATRLRGVPTSWAKVAVSWPATARRSWAPSSSRRRALRSTCAASSSFLALSSASAASMRSWRLLFRPRTSRMSASRSSPASSSWMAMSLKRWAIRPSSSLRRTGARALGSPRSRRCMVSTMASMGSLMSMRRMSQSRMNSPRRTPGRVFRVRLKFLFQMTSHRSRSM